MRRLIIISLLVIGGCWLVAGRSPALAAEYFISPTGSDTQNGLSQSSPIKTFTKAWTLVKPGDTLWLMNGTYYQSIAPTINGMANPAIVDPPGSLDPNHPLDSPARTQSFIFIKALVDGQAVIDGEYQRVPVNLGGDGFFGKGNYVWLQGIVAQNSSSSVINIQSKNVVVKRVTAANANPYQNVHVFNIFSGGTLTAPANILLEDCAATGSGRKMFMAYHTSVNVIFRRLVSLHQAVWWGGQSYDGTVGGAYCGNHWQQSDSIEIYNGDQPDTPTNSIVENSISFGGGASYGFNLNPNPQITIGNSFLGDISLYNGMNYDGTFKAWDCQSIPEVCHGTRCADLAGWPGVRTGFHAGGSGSPFFKDNRWQDIFAARNASHGFVAGNWAAESTNNTLTRATLIDNGVGQPVPNQGPGINLTNANMFTSITDSRIPGTAYDGGQGAKFVNRYVNGVLTDQPLWPLPMQDRILKEFGIDVTGEVTAMLDRYGVPHGASLPVPNFSPLPARPVTNLNPGKFNVTYHQPLSVTLSTSVTGAAIRYTLNGDEPTSASPLYAGPFQLNTSTLVKAKVFSGTNASHSKSAYYRISSGTNEAPQVDAKILAEKSNSVSGDSLEIVLPRNYVYLYGQVEDFTFPQALSALVTTWEQVSGPGTVTFADAAKPRTKVTFPAAGQYTLKLTASDGSLSTTDEVTVRVWPADLVGITFPVPGKIEAENYRAGGEGTGYHQVHSYGDVIYRSSKVDSLFADKEGGYSIEDIYPLEWEAYAVNITSAGTYRIRTRLAVSIGGGTFHFELDGEPITGPIAVPTDPAIALHNYNYYTDLDTITTKPLPTGDHVLKFVADTPSTAGIQLNMAVNYFDLSLSDAPPPLIGDLNQDGNIDFIDFSALLSVFNQPSPLKLVGTGLIDIFDINKLISLL